jgi:penicillin-binding protein-related factor A (putative recombinase)
VHKEYLPTLPVKDAKWAKVVGKITVDYVGQLAGGRFVAFDAKDCAGKRIELERLQAHQLRFLEIAEALGGLAFVLVRFERARAYAVPAAAWRWADEAHRAGHAVYVEELGWRATGKASINEKEMKPEWRVDGTDWAETVRNLWLRE